MRVLVTGGAGFIGSHYVRLLLSDPEIEVVNFDLLTYAGNPANNADAAKSPRYSFVKGDVADAREVEGAMAGVSEIVHFAAESHVDRSIASGDAFVRTNVLGTQILLDAARRHDASFLLVSTDEVYGSIEHGSFRETDALRPSSPYSASKAGADLLALSHRHTYGLKVKVTRSSNNFGPHQHPEKFIPLFITRALRGERMPLYGDGKNVRDWIHVEDNCAALDVVRRRGADGEAYNVGAGNELPNVEVAKRIVRALGRPESLIELVRDRPGHDRRYSVDASKVRALGWKPASGFDERLAETVRWYRENEAWWRPLVRAP